MKKIFLSLVVLLSGVAITQNASAGVRTGPAWSCRIHANLEGFEGGFVVVVKSFEGRGEMRCRSIDGATLRRFPIHMSIKGAGLGVGLSLPRNLRFVTADIGVTHPGYLYGQYSGGISADGTLIDLGGTVGLSISFSKRGASVRGVLAGGEVSGLMGAITGSIVHIRPL